MIPKIIHYCWFGKGIMPELAIKCTESWKKHLPDYEIMLWNEDNFDINSVPFVKQAYQAKKWAFITDYVRLYAIYNYGGVYMDTDVEVLKSLDVFLNLPAFSGFESPQYIPTGIMASQKHGKWAEEMLSYYKDRNFILPDGSFDTKTNVTIITNLMLEKGLVLNNKEQNIQNILHLFPSDYFCPIGQDGVLRQTKNTYTIHHFSGSWLSKSQKMKIKLMQKIISNNFTLFLYSFYRRIKYGK